MACVFCTRFKFQRNIKWISPPFWKNKHPYPVTINQPLIIAKNGRHPYKRGSIADVHRLYFVSMKNTCLTIVNNYHLWYKQLICYMTIICKYSGHWRFWDVRDYTESYRMSDLSLRVTRKMAVVTYCFDDSSSFAWTI